MAEFSQWLSLLSGVVVLPAFAVVSFLLHWRLRSWGTLTLCSGLFAATAGIAIQTFFSASIRTLSEAEVQDLLISGEFTHEWYIGSLVFQIGLLVALIGFISVVMKTQRQTVAPNNALERPNEK